MGKNYAELTDVTVIWREMTQPEMERAKALIPIISASLREEARKVGKDLDAMIQADEDLAAIAKSVTVDVVARTLMTSTNQEPVTQFAESALGYSVSGSYLVPGGGLFIKKSELARLGLRRPRMGVIEPYGIPEGNNHYPV